MSWQLQLTDEMIGMQAIRIWKEKASFSISVKKDRTLMVKRKTQIQFENL